MSAQRQAMDVAKNASAQPANEVARGSSAAVTKEVHKQAKQYAEHLRDQLESKDAALQAKVRRAQISSGVIEKLRQELRKKALKAKLHLKDTELQNGIQRVSLLSTSIRVLREDLQKRGPARPAQFSIVCALPEDSRRMQNASGNNRSATATPITSAPATSTLRTSKRQWPGFLLSASACGT